MNNEVFTTSFGRYGTQTITITVVQTGTNTYKVIRKTEVHTRPENNRVEDDSQYRMDNGVPRWLSNNSVPPADSIREYCIDKTPGFDQAKTDAIRQTEIQAELAGYRNTNRKHSAEEIYEMTAAFGPGATVVNVITGQRTKLPGRKQPVNTAHREAAVTLNKISEGDTVTFPYDNVQYEAKVDRINQTTATVTITKINGTPRRKIFVGQQLRVGAGILARSN